MLAGDYPVALADWSPSPGDAFDCAAPLYVAVASPEHGCGKPDEGSQALALPAGARSLRAEGGDGALALATVTRGVCPFIDKTRSMQKLGAAAVVVINTDNSAISLPAGDKRTGDIVAPVVSVGREVRAGPAARRRPARRRDPAPSSP